MAICRPNRPRPINNIVFIFLSPYPTVNFSWGSRAVLPFLFPEDAAKINVKPPTRPIYISKTKMARDGKLSSGVIPRVNPTVATADAVSYRQSNIGSPSIRLINSPPPKNIVIYMIKTATAFRTVSSSILRPKNGYAPCI